DLRVGRGRKAEAAVFRRDDAAEQPHLLHLLDDLGRIDVVMLESVDVRLDLGLQELVDHVEHETLVLDRFRFFDNCVHCGLRYFVAASASASARAPVLSQPRTASRMRSADARGAARSALSKNFATTSSLLNGRSAQPRLIPSRCRKVRPSAVSTITSPV